MKRTGVVLLTVGAVILLIVGVAGAVFYVKVYRPIGSPLMAMAGGMSLEKRLKNVTFLPPASRELTADQVARFAGVEEEVQRRLHTRLSSLAVNKAALEQASETRTLSLAVALKAFGQIKNAYLDAKTTQIDAMNRANFSKKEFEWVRKQLYDAAGLRLSQVDVSEVVAGEPDAAVVIRTFDPTGHAAEHNQRLALPLTAKLETWAALGFFGL